LRSLLLPLALASASVAVLQHVRAPAALAQQSLHFTDVKLMDGSAIYDKAEVHVRIRESRGGYTRADYFDPKGRRLGFYEAFEVVSRDEPALRDWAVRNFPDRTSSGP
jgi:hypothetical protein